MTDVIVNWLQEAVDAWRASDTRVAPDTRRIKLRDDATNDRQRDPGVSGDYKLRAASRWVLSSQMSGTPARAQARVNLGRRIVGSRLYRDDAKPAATHRIEAEPQLNSSTRRVAARTIARQHANRLLVRNQAAHEPPYDPLPPAIFRSNQLTSSALQQPPAACYLLHTLGFVGFPRGRPMAAVPWRTAYCGGAGDGATLYGAARVDAAVSTGGSLAHGATPVADTTAEGELASALTQSNGSILVGGSAIGSIGRGARRHERASAHDAQNRAPLPHWMQAVAVGCVDVDAWHKCTRSVESWQGRLPRVWLFCLHSQNARNPKRSPGVNAYVPGATILLPVRPHLASAVDGGALRISLKHLVSYTQMGVVALTCSNGCACLPSRIDASWEGRHGSTSYRNKMGRNISAHLTYSFLANVTRATSECVVALTVARASSSGGHRFILNEVTLQAV